MIDIMVGCPVSSREWVLNAWFDHTLKSLKQIYPEVEASVQFVFVTPSGDSSINVIERRTKNFVTHIVTSNEPVREDKRNWNEERIRNMVYVRNLLLNVVRNSKPEFFLSVDSDILLHERTVQRLVTEQTENGFDAVGGKTFLTSTGTSAPSYGVWKGEPSIGRFTRHNIDYTTKVDVLMAIKLMTPKAYNVDYKFARQGEDIGWSQNCYNQNVGLGFVGDVTNKHVMEPKQLSTVDPRIGW